MMIEAFILLVLALVAFYAVLHVQATNERKSIPPGFPPGPTTLPFMESFQFSSSNLLKTVEKLRKKFGDIIGLQFGKKNVVIISDYELIQEAYNTPALCGHHETEVDAIIAQKTNLGNALSVIQTDGPGGNLERKFILKTLRDFGFGQRTIESIILKDVSDSINHFKSKLGEPVNPVNSLKIGVFNAILRFITDQEFAQHDPKLHSLWENFETVMTSEKIQIPTLLTRFLPNQLSGKKKLENAVTAVEKFLSDQIAEHKLKLGKYEDEFPADFMEIYLQEILDKNSPLHGVLTELNLLLTCLSLFEGSRKACLTILWALYHVASDTFIQKKLRDEIDHQVGLYRFPAIKDKLVMPYTEAVMLETFRMSSLSPFGNPYNSTTDVTFHGFNIPQDTLILTNLHDVHHDAKHWQDPDKFRPERFLTSDEKEVAKAHRSVIWSTIGKRAVPNELLASDTFFLFITSLFQRFNFSINESNSTFGSSELVQTVPPFRVTIEDRLEFLDRSGQGK